MSWRFSPTITGPINKILDACRRLPNELYVQEPVLAWSSVRSTISYIALATEFNLRTVARDPDDRIPSEADLATVDDVAHVAEKYLQVL